MVMAIILLCVVFISRRTGGGADISWWGYSDVFFIFIAAFCRLVSVLFAGSLPGVSRRMNVCAIVSLILAVIALVADYFLM